VEKQPIEVEGIDPNEKRECEKCGKPMVLRTSARGAFWGCTGYPKCKNIVAIEGAQVTANKPEPTMSEHLCPNCGKGMIQRKGRFGPFLGCSGYPDCKTIVNLDKEGKPKWPVAGDAPKPVKKAAPRKKAAAPA